MLLERTLRGLTQAGAAVAALCIWALTGIIGFDVLARATGNPTLWASEMSVYLMIAMGFMGAAHTFERDGHFRVGLVADRLPGRGSVWLDLAVTLVGLGFVALFAFGSIQLVMMLRSLGFRSSTLMQVPTWIPMAPVALGSVFLASAMLLRAMAVWRSLRQHSQPAPRAEHTV